MPQALTRFAATALLALAAALGNAQANWGDITVISGTLGNHSNRLCLGDGGNRVTDIGCPSYAPSVSTAGHVSITGNVSANKFLGDGSGLTNLNVQGDRIVSDTHSAIVNQNTGYVSLTAGGSTWGYFSAGWSYLSNLFSNTVSSSLVSATNVSATYVDVTRSGTVSGTYGYFRYISGTDIHGRFTGDGSGLSGVIAGSSDRIVSGSSGGTRMVAISSSGYISITQAGSNSGWFDPYRGLVTLGVSSTGGISGTTGYFSGDVGIGAAANGGKLHVYAPSGTPNVRVQSGAGVVDLASDGSSGYLTNFNNNGILAYTTVGAGGLHSFYVSGSERVRIGTGGMAIGTGSFGSSLTVAGEAQVGSSGVACVTATNAGAIRYSGGILYYCNSSSAWTALSAAGGGLEDRIVSGSTNAIAWQDRSLTITTNNVQRMVVGENGVVGIGTSTPSTSAMLHVEGGGVFVSASSFNAFGHERSGLTGYFGLGSNGTLYVRAPSSSQFIKFRAGTDDADHVTIRPGGNVGIGLTMPAATLQVSGSFTVSTSGQTAARPSVYVGSDGNVGIGTSDTPSATLTVMANNRQLVVSTPDTRKQLRLEYNTSSNTAAIGIEDGYSVANLVFRNNGAERMRVTNSGRVGIGTESPSSSLHVGGEVQVGSGGGACTSVNNGGAIRYSGGTLFYCNASNTWAALGTSAGVTGTGSATAVAYWSSSTGLTYDTDGFYWDATNNRLGIGTNEPTSNVHIAMDGSPMLKLSGAGSSLTNAAFLSLERYRGTNAVPNYTTPGDWLGVINFLGYTSERRIGAGIRGYADDGWGTTGADSPGSLAFLTTPDGAGTPQERVRINSSGSMGVGTGSPTATLQVSGSFIVSTSMQHLSPSLFVGTDGSVGMGTSAPTFVNSNYRGVHINADGGSEIRLTNTTTGATANDGFTIQVANASLNAYLWQRENAHIMVGTSATERIRITGAGNVGISTTTPLAKLDVNGTISATDAIQIGTSSLACSAGIPGAMRYNAGSMQYCNGTSWTTLGGGGTLTGTGSATAVAFWSGSNALTYSGGFYWDNTNKRLGVGTNTPGEEVSVEISGTAAIELRNSGTNGRTWHIQNRSGAESGHFRIADMTANDSRLEIDENGNVGIGGQRNPASTLQVSGSFIVSSTQKSATPSLFVGADGRVGLGTLAPEVTFENQGRLRLLSTTESAPTSGVGLEAFYSGSNDRGTIFAYDRGTTTAKDLGLGGSGSALMIKGGGSVGIGTLQPSATLHVVGTVSVTDALQLGRNTIACGAQVSGSIRYSILSNTVQFCDGIGWVSLASDTTSGVSALGDRITSGTLVMVANSATSYVSLSTNGTTWGYLNGGLSYLPALSAGRVSSINISGSIIQVGNTGVACTAGISGSMRYSSVSSTMEYCNSTAWVSMGPSDTVPVSFRVHKNGTNQTVATNSYVMLTWSDEEFDSNNNFSGNKYTPTVPGRYIFNVSAYCTSVEGCAVYVYKNGTPVSGNSVGPSSTNNAVAQASTIVSMNGTTDYVEAFVYLRNGTTIDGNIGFTNFSGALLGSQSGGGSGGDSSDLAGLSDVQLTNLAGRDYLRYDSVSSKWVNISESTVMSKTTMVPNWPDSIVCPTDWGTMQFEICMAPSSNDGRYHYCNPWGEAIQYNTNGSYHSASGSTGVAGQACENQSISQLYAQGRAFNLIGNSGTGGGGTALGDRITSGTLAMIANSATSIVSLSTNGTTWGYLNSINSYLPQLSATRVSSTNVSASTVQLRGTTVTAAGGAANYIVSGSARVSVSSAGTLSFADGGTVKLVVDGNGNVGIGASSTLPLGGSKQIVGGFGATAVGGSTNWNDASNARSGNGATLLLGSGTNGPGGNFYYHPFSFEYQSKDGTGNMTQLAVAYGESTSAFTNGAMFMRSRYVGSWSGWYKFTTTAVSDYRAKEHVTPLAGGLEKVMALKPIHFDYKEGLGTTGAQDGFYAHELADVAPYAVTGTKDQVDASGNPQYQSIDLARLTPLLASAVQQLKHDNDNQQAQIIRLEEVVQELRGTVDQLQHDLRELKQAKHK